MSERPQASILIIDDDQIVAESLAEFLARRGYATTRASDGQSGLDALARSTEEAREGTGSPINLVICDVSLPTMDGIEVLRRVRDEHPGVAVIMLTGYGTIESAVAALRCGAADYLTKPVVDAELEFSLERALRQHALLAENHTLRHRLSSKEGPNGIVGNDPRMLKIFELIEAVAPSRTTVLMTGESGVGKSMIAHAIHDQSPRQDGPFVEISCGSIPETLLESELFGHVRGAFTGAHADKTGRFLAADGGTIFLDEINSASPGMQLKLLRVLQERRFEPVGSSETIEVDVRVVLATNQPLERLVEEGAFRQDLYYRINVVRIELPPLRDRVSDIPVLAHRFLEHHGSELGRQLIGFTDEAMAALCRYSYPGNVRELQNVIERAAVLSRTPTIGVEDLPDTVLGADAEDPTSVADHLVWTPAPLAEALREPERRILIAALEANEWNRQKTADQLEINRTTLYKKMKSHGLLGRAAG